MGSKPWFFYYLCVAVLLLLDRFGSNCIWAKAGKLKQSACGVAQLQGRRPQQEDRAICIPELIIPGIGGNNGKEILVSLFGVFDDHNGAEASDLALAYLPCLLRHHTWSILNDDKNHKCDHTAYLDLFYNHDFGALGQLSLFDLDNSEQEETLTLLEREPLITSPSMSRMILKEAHLRALVVIDSIFIKESWMKGWQSGSTAVVGLKADRHLLVANIGDSKAFLFSACITPTESTRDLKVQGSRTEKEDISVLWSAKELLTVDHRPSRLSQRARIEAAGGFVSTWDGVPRVNGQLAISRAIGDVPFKRYGVIAEPEFTEWQEQSAHDLALLLTSDGVFENMKLQDVCDILHDRYKSWIDLKFSQNECTLDLELYSQALAETVVHSAFDSGSTDNLAVVVHSTHFGAAQELTSRIITVDAKNHHLHSPKSKSREDLVLSSDMDGNQQNKIMPKFIEQQGACYELVERLSTGLVLPLRTFLDHGVSGLDKLLEDMATLNTKDSIALGQKTGIRGQLEIYHDHLVCLPQSFLTDEDEVCLNPESFSNYLKLIAIVPAMENVSVRDSSSEKVAKNSSALQAYTSIHHRYVLTKNIGRGGFGEVWFALLQDGLAGWPKSEKPFISPGELQKFLSYSSQSSLLRPSVDAAPQQETFVLKRILVEKGDTAYMSGLREKYFGEIFLAARSQAKSQGGNEETEEGLRHIARYIESFQVNMDSDLWLVFRNEGSSLSSLLYTVDTTVEMEKEIKEGGHIQVLQPSEWWKWLKTTKEGQHEMRNLIHQLLLAVKACHDRNITHRDIKPENMMVRAKSHCLVTRKEGELLMDWPCNVSMRIIDFGSAIDAYTLAHLYGANGPSRVEQTMEYTPPESLLQRNWLKSHGTLASMYDMWSIGIVFLELVLGTPHVFQISARTRAELEKQLEGWGRSALDAAYKLRALMEMCILFPGHGAHHQYITNLDSANLVSWKCTEENIIQKIKECDPLGLGLQDIWALRLLRALLQWHPEDRITAEAALQHPYFHPILQGHNHST